MGEVVAIDMNRRPRAKKTTSETPMPEKWTPAEKVEILTWARDRNYTLEELEYATEMLRDWWETRRQMRTSWPTVLKRAVREGWALRGFEKEMKRRGRVDVNERTGETFVRRTPVTQERIDKWAAQCR